MQIITESNLKKQYPLDMYELHEDGSLALTQY